MAKLKECLYECVACGDNGHKVRFRAPTWHTATTIKWVCPDCGSRIFIMFSRHKSLAAGQIKIDDEILDMSERAKRKVREQDSIQL